MVGGPQLLSSRLHWFCVCLQQGAAQGPPLPSRAEPAWVVSYTVFRGSWKLGKVDTCVRVHC